MCISSLLKKTCVRQVVSDKWSPLRWGTQQGGRLWACPRVWLSARLFVLSSLSLASGSYSHISSEWISISLFDNFQRRMSRLEQRWRAQRSVISIVNCRIPWTNRDLNVHCAFHKQTSGCSRSASWGSLRPHDSPSHRRGTLKGVPTVKSPTSHFKLTLKSLKSNLFYEPFLAYPFCGTVNHVSDN